MPHTAEPNCEFLVARVPQLEEDSNWSKGVWLAPARIARLLLIHRRCLKSFKAVHNLPLESPSPGNQRNQRYSGPLDDVAFLGRFNRRFRTLSKNKDKYCTAKRQGRPRVLCLLPPRLRQRPWKLCKSSHRLTYLAFERFKFGATFNSLVMIPRPTSTNLIWRLSSLSSFLWREGCTKKFVSSCVRSVCSNTLSFGPSSFDRRWAKQLETITTISSLENTF